MKKLCPGCASTFEASPSGARFCSKSCGYRGRVATSGGQRTGFRGDLNTRLDRYTQRTETCWNWVGTKYSTGYGKIGMPMANGVYVGGHKEVPAHRAMYERYVGPIPKGLDLDHLCRNRACVNPAHLEPVTRSVNLRRGAGVRGIDERETHCPQGHEFTPANTYIWAKEPTKKRCKTCANRLHRRRVA